MNTLLLQTTIDTGDAISNAPITNKTELITCVVTIIVGAIIRAIEKRQMNKRK